eukprot:TRINITY_DN61060_c0_g1_i1.p1 TRINITY_DN61060_c0_g1~~TRINITY_DN61060_c0_g1_i1.p1  ORF type:complete len:767 (+),score=93.71 TRINITY_DN61060_c0_g1_i1:40-2340(+)
MGSGASVTYGYNSIDHVSGDGTKTAAAGPPAPWSWAAWLRPDGSPDANAAYSFSSGNTGPSNCGEASAFSVISALGLGTPAAMGTGAVRVNKRDYDTEDMAKYLSSRAVAGCTADDIIQGIQTLSEGAVEARFFGLGPASEVSRSKFHELPCTLARWIAAGGIAVATLNQQAVMDSDCWHHQLVWGAGAPETSGVLLANSVFSISAERLGRMLGADRILEIMRHDVECRIGTGDAESARTLFASTRWKDLDVAGQIKRLESNDDPNAKIQIPASYVAGITLCAPKNTPCAKEIVRLAGAHSTGAALPSPSAAAVRAAPLALLPAQLGLGCDINAHGVFALVATDCSLLAELGVPPDRVAAFTEILAMEIQSKPLEKAKSPCGNPEWDKLLGKETLPAETLPGRVRSSLRCEAKSSWQQRLTESRAFCEIDAWLRTHGAVALEHHVHAIVASRKVCGGSSSSSRASTGVPSSSASPSLGALSSGSRASSPAPGRGRSPAAGRSSAGSPAPRRRSGASPATVRSGPGKTHGAKSDQKETESKSVAAYEEAFMYKEVSRQLLLAFYSQAAPQPTADLGELLAMVGNSMAAGKVTGTISAGQGAATFTVTNKIDSSHKCVRDQAYPYDVSHLQGGEGEIEKDLVVDARSDEGNLLGFTVVNFGSGKYYIADVAVAPAAQGRGLGASLIREAARASLHHHQQQCAAHTDSDEASTTPAAPPLMHLHVRLYNLTARALYLKLGFRETARCFPGWYDWHGGVAMETELQNLIG